tara:strand:- start:38 stop:790 length:753 start_codon:yes stop_codon:yes gene_type:complete
MKNSAKTFILLPAFNEEEGIEKLLERLIRITRTFLKEYRIIIVNDGSSDHTLDVIECFRENLNIEIISFNKNRGIVDVFRQGFQKVCEEGDDGDICITMDSDNTQNPYVINDILEKMNDGYDIVIASRFVEGGKVVGAPWFRNLLSNGVAFLMRRIAAVPGVTDYSTFYRGIRVGLLRRGFERYGDELISGHGFSGMANLLVRLCPFAIRTGEVPFILRYDLKEGGTGMRILKTIQGYLILFVNILKEKK